MKYKKVNNRAVINLTMLALERGIVNASTTGDPGWERGGVARAFFGPDVKRFHSLNDRYGEGFRAIYFIDKYGARKFDGTTRYRGVACDEGISSC